jgi:hypothetical protein
MKRYVDDWQGSGNVWAASMTEDVEIAVLEEAARLIRSNECKRDGWTTWNTFSGRNEEHVETTEQWTRRALRMAMDKMGVARDTN